MVVGDPMFEGGVVSCATDRPDAFASPPPAGVLAYLYWSTTSECAMRFFVLSRYMQVRPLARLTRESALLPWTDCCFAAFSTPTPPLS